ncbi:MAG: ATP-dependent helicase [Microbacteriaceae bacterium]|nr:ATP-dependent helicase [Microbacteriaceae bacterium]
MAITGFRRGSGAVATSPVALDPSQFAVLQLGDSASAVILGAPGTGKTTTMVELVAHRVEQRGFAPEEVLALTSSRTTATRLRDRLAVRIGRPTNGPLARTTNSLAFSIVGEAARAAGVEPPRLITGGEQDSDIAFLLEGQIEDGTSTWPPALPPEVRRLRGFRSELRELMARATDHGVNPARLRELATIQQRPEWSAAADFIDVYLRAAAANPERASQLDSSELLQFAIAAINRGDAVPALRLVVVDDLQEAPRSTMSLLAALAQWGVAIVAFGDPDVATNSFRGGEADALGRLGAVLGLGSIRTMALSTAHRQPAALRALTSRVTERIGTAGAVGQRAAVATGVSHDENPGEPVREPVLRILAESPAREWAAIARQLRERHLLDGVPWAQMAVVVRSGAQVPLVAKALALAEVPTRTAVGGTALRDDHAARSLLTLVDVGIGRTALTPAIANELLLGPLGGLDHLAVRRLRLALRAEEVAGDGRRSSDELLVEALSAPGRLITIDHRSGRSAERLADTLATIRVAATDGGTIEELLWMGWERSRLAKGWFAEATSAGIGADEANRNLDGIVALFTAAKRFVERKPGTPAGVFLDELLDAEVPEDTLSPQSSADTVLVSTPSGVVGLQFDTVVVAALQEGAWPNLRLRGSLLYPQQLVRAVTGLDSAVIDERRQVRDDELRMFALAVSRASSQVILAAVASEDETASVLFAFAPPGSPVIDSARLRPLTLRGLTGRLRRELSMPGRSGVERAAAASALAKLAMEKVPGASPDEWHGLLAVSTDEPLYLEGDRVPVSPSRLEAFEESPLDWFVESVSGTQASTAMGLGTIVHWAMETAEDPSVDTIWRGIEQRWNELSFESPWFAEQQKRAARVLAAGVAEYLADFERDGKTLAGRESRFSIELDVPGREPTISATVNGSIDRVERAADGSVVIVDLKTGTAITKQALIDEHPQLGAYQLAYVHGVLDAFLDELGEHSGGGAKLLYVKKGVDGKLYREGSQASLDHEQLEGFRDRIRQAAIGMAAASFAGEVDLDEWGGFDLPAKRLRRVRAVSSD